MIKKIPKSKEYLDIFIKSHRKILWNYALLFLSIVAMVFYEKLIDSYIPAFIKWIIALHGIYAVAYFIYSVFLGDSRCPQCKKPPTNDYGLAVFVRRCKICGYPLSYSELENDLHDQTR
ncbi:hypothetical protein [Limnohabitans sp.]|uniref:hypothetical protein n=1 Tax=Limnohabitans sp. TaxID=1907725 RepID=UPI00286F867C|nr:hypothetical protein [Limnohabitans sp.]